MYSISMAHGEISGPIVASSTLDTASDKKEIHLLFTVKILSIIQALGKMYSMYMQLMAQRRITA
jgi:hypothetical protein